MAWMKRDIWMLCVMLIHTYNVSCSVSTDTHIYVTVCNVCSPYIAIYTYISYRMCSLYVLFVCVVNIETKPFSIFMANLYMQMYTVKKSENVEKMGFIRA